MRICVIGAFGDLAEARDGQTVKTWATYNALKKNDSFNMMKVDTKLVRKHKLRFMANLFFAILLCDKAILMVSVNGRKILIPRLARLQDMGFIQVYHSLIGGKLAEEARDRPSLVGQLNSFSANWVEDPVLVEELKELGVENASHLRNFKDLVAAKEKLPESFSHGGFKFVVFSRITRDKGITDAILSVAAANKREMNRQHILDIYGVIDPDYESEFRNLLDLHSDFVSYKGVADPFNTVNILAEYDCLLFPTRFKDEGMPGTIIDAYFAGLPVVARRWNFVPRELAEGKVGILYDDPEDLASIIENLPDDKDKLSSFSMNCIKQAAAYSEKSVMSVVEKALLDA